jgi:arginine utilization protein RocB
MSQWSTKQQLRQLLCNLVKIPSISGSDAEMGFPDYVVEQLGSLPYFESHPEHLQKHGTGDGRFFVTALVKKASARRTVIMVSHYDVVDVIDYGRFRRHAFDAEKLTTMFTADKHEMPDEVRKDIESGNWLFGRGTMDMKCGLTLHMAMIEKACAGAFDGSLLLLTVPDEEVNSVGMRVSIPVLLDICRKHDLEYNAVFNSEPMFPKYPGDTAQYIYSGSIGKVLPGFLCYGKETHVGAPFSGLNANFMTSLLTAELEVNCDFCEAVGGEVTAPPTVLLQRDLKAGYSVQVSHHAVSLFNLFLLDKPMNEVTEALKQAANRVAERISQSYRERAMRFATLTDPFSGELQVNVLTYQELEKYAMEKYGKQHVDALLADVIEHRGNVDDRDLTIQLVDALAALCKDLSPMIVLFFAPPYYPAVSSRNHPIVEHVIPAIIDYAYERHAVVLTSQHYFGGISDLSYVGLQQPVTSMFSLTSNMPLWNKGYHLPLSEMEQFNVPVLNLGPNGKDAHQWTERLDVDYAFETLFDMMTACIHELLAFGKE